MASQNTMKAVVFEGPFKVSVQDVPRPTLQDDQDIIVQVQATALCGSELHTYRGREKCDPGFIMGHEFVGTVVETGATVTSVKVGDKVVTPFTVSCGDCYYCQDGHTSRCTQSLLFGSPSLNGGQAEFVRVPLADGSVMKAPESVSDQTLVLMADIFPTGYYGVRSAIELCPKVQVQDSVMVIIGCGPVGLCAIAAAIHFGPKRIFAIDSVDSRLELARGLGAEPLNFLHDKDGMLASIKAATNGRGADMVVEVVGQPAALKTAYDVVRPFGSISSIGVHGAEIPFSGEEGYDKNIRLQMGRCPVRGVFAESLAVLETKQHEFGFMFDKIMPLSEAVEGYDLFDKLKVQKVVFRV
ncbi:GroES-like protein [Sarocladium strictum]